jgi:hypothetical protein
MKKGQMIRQFSSQWQQNNKNNNKRKEENWGNAEKHLTGFFFFSPYRFHILFVLFPFFYFFCLQSGKLCSVISCCPGNKALFSVTCQLLIGEEMSPVGSAECSHSNAPKKKKQEYKQKKKHLSVSMLSSPKCTCFASFFF